MPARERGDEEQFDRVVLADDDLADFLTGTVPQVDQIFVWACSDVRHAFLPDRSLVSRYFRLGRRYPPLGSVFRPGESAVEQGLGVRELHLPGDHRLQRADAVRLFGDQASQCEGRPVGAGADADA